MIDLPSFREPLAVAAALLLAAPAVPQAPAPAPAPAANSVLDRLEAGRWELRGAAGARIADICVGDRMLLAQPQHGAAPCQRTVLASDARSLTVRYACPGTGSGRTVIRVETPRLAQIESQGLDRGIPFAIRAEARRTAACS